MGRAKLIGSKAATDQTRDAGVGEHVVESREGSKQLEILAESTLTNNGVADGEQNDSPIGVISSRSYGACQVDRF